MSRIFTKHKRKTRRAYKMNLKENERERHGKESVKVQSGLNCQRTGCTEFVSGYTDT